MSHFDFHGELFDIRITVIDGLAEHGYTWLSDYGAVDIRHDDYGLEVTAIRDESVARDIERHLRCMLPNWRQVNRYYEDLNTLEIGWKVVVTKKKECFVDHMLPRPPLRVIIRQAIRNSLATNFPTIRAWIAGRADRHSGDGG